MEGVVGPSSSGYQGVSQIWAISTGGETYRGGCQACLGECTFLCRLAFPIAQQMGKKILFLYRNRSCFRKKIYPPL